MKLPQQRANVLQTFYGEVMTRLVDNPEIIAIYEEAMRRRAQLGLPRQQLDESYCRRAQAWTNYMRFEGFHQHGGGEEIIAWDGNHLAFAASVIDRWMRSPGHYRWLTSNSSKVGFGLSRAWKSGMTPAQGGTWWAGEFTGGLADNPDPVPGPPIPEPTPTPTPIPKPPKRPTPFLDWLRKLFGF